MSIPYFILNGTDVSAKIAPGSVQINNELTSQPDTCSFRLIDPDAVPREGQVIQIYVGTTADMRFAGVIDSVQESLLSSWDHRIYNVNAVDYQRILEFRLVAESYQSKTCKYIIEDLIANYVAVAWGITTTNVQTGPTIEEINFNYVTVADAIRRLAQITGYEWYVDYDKDVYFFASATLTAPYSISNVPGFSFEKFVLQPDLSQIRNRVFFSGGNFLSSPITQTFAGDDVTDTFTLTYKPHAIGLDENGTAKTVGIENITDPATVDYIMNYGNKTIERTAAALPSGVTLTATYSYQAKVLVQYDDPAAQAYVAALEGGDGIHEHQIIDTSIDTNEEAFDMSKADVDKNGIPMLRGGFETYTDGFAAGQLIDVNITGHAFNGSYLIQNVRAFSIGGGSFKYTVLFSERKKTVEDILVGLIRKSTIQTADSDAIEKIIAVGENIELSPAITVTLTDVTATPYVYGPGANVAIVGFSQWG